MRVRALTIASGLLGVMEQGGNNMGPKVSQIIKANGGLGPEPWCGDFVAYCYRNAGSNAVTPSWPTWTLIWRWHGPRFIRGPCRTTAR